MKRGFSPLETLIVIIFIAIMISVFYSKYQKIEEETKNTLRNNEINILNLALDLYKTKKGHYPDNLSALFSENVIDNKSKDFFDPQKRISNDKVLDPFGKPYLYDSKTGRAK